MKDEEIKKEFMGLHAGDVVTFNLRKAFPNNVELGSILHLKKEEVAHIDSDFQFTLEEISKFENAEINQELFDKIFGKDIVSSMDEFNARLVAEIQVNLSRETDNKFRIDTKSLLLDKSNFKLPEAFLKRWIISTNEGKSTMEQIEQDFVKFERDLKWHLIQNKIISEHELKLTDEEIIEFARKQTRIQFEQYGLYNTTEEQINNYTQESLKQDDYRRHILEHMYEDKVFEFIRESVTLVTKEVTAEEFDKILEEESIT